MMSKGEMWFYGICLSISMVCFSLAIGKAWGRKGAREVPEYHEEVCDTIYVGPYGS